MGFDGGAETVEGVAMLLAAAFDHGEYGFYEPAAARALRAKAKPAPRCHAVHLGAIQVQEARAISKNGSRPATAGRRRFPTSTILARPSNSCWATSPR